MTISGTHVTDMHLLTLKTSESSYSAFTGSGSLLLLCGFQIFAKRK